jgi:hypothetical protein
MVPIHVAPSPVPPRFAGWWNTIPFMIHGITLHVDGGNATRVG